MAKAQANEELDLDGDEESDYESNSDNDDDDTDNNTDNSDNDDEDDDEENDNNDEDDNSDAEESNDDHDSDDDDDDDDDQEHDDDTNPLLSDDDDDPDASQCPICLMSLTGQQLGTPNNCDHVFCFLCISEWSKNSNTCPVDRKKFGEILVHQTKKGPVTKKVKVEDKHVPNDQDWEQAPTYCEICEQCNREAMMLLCDGCDRGYHMFCLTPRMHLVPEGDWYCDMCLVIRNESIPDVDIPVNQPQTSMDSAPSTSGQATTSSTKGRTASTRARGRGRRRTTTTRRPRSSSTRRKTKKRGRTTSRTTKKTKTKTSKRGRSASATSRRKTTKKKTATRKRKRKTMSKKSPRKKRRRNEDDNTASFMLPSRSSRERLNTSNALSIYGNEFALHDFDANEDVVPKEEKETPPKRSQPSSTDVLSSILDEIEVLHDEDAQVSRDGRVLPAKSCGLKFPKTTPPEKTRNSEKSPLKRPSTQSSVEHERPKMKKVSFLDTTSDETEVTRYCPENTSTSETSSTINSHIKCADISNNARQENSSYTHDKILLGSEKYSSDKTSKTEKTRFEQNPDNSTDKHPEFASICRINSEKNNASTAPMLKIECEGITSNQRTESSVYRNRISTFQERTTGDMNNLQEMLASKHSETASTSKDNNEKSNDRKLQRNNEFQENPTSGCPQSSSLSRRDSGYSKPSVQAGELQCQSKSRHRHTSEPDEKPERSHKYDQERISSMLSKSSTLNDPILTSQLYDTRKPGPVSRKTLTESRMTSYRYVKDQTWIASGSVCRSTSSPSSIIPTVTSHLDESPSLLHSRSSVISSAVTTATVTSREKGKKKQTSSRFDISHTPSPPVNTTHQTLSSRFSDYSTAPSVSMSVTSTDSRQIEFKDKSNKLRVNVAEPERQITTSKPSLSSNFTHHSLPKLKSMNVAPSLPSRPKLKGLVTKHDGKNSPTLNASYPPYKTTDTNYQQNLAIIDMLRSKKSSLKAEIKKETTSEQQKDFNTLFAIDDPLTSPSHGCGESKSLKTAIKSEHDGMLSKAETIKSSVNVPEFKTRQGQQHQVHSRQHALEIGKTDTNLVQPQTQLHSSQQSYSDSYSTLPTRCENFHRPKLPSLIDNSSRPSSLPVAIVKPSRAVENEKVAAKHDGKIDSPTSTAPLLYAAQSTSLSAAEAERVENRKKGIARLQRLSSIKDSVRLALQPFYNHKEITRNEFKDIFVKAVQKVHQSSSPIDFIRISELVKKYVKKYKGRRC